MRRHSLTNNSIRLTGQITSNYAAFHVCFIPYIERIGPWKWKRMMEAGGPFAAACSRSTFWLLFNRHQKNSFCSPLYYSTAVTSHMAIRMNRILRFMHKKKREDKINKYTNHEKYVKCIRCDGKKRAQTITTHQLIWAFVVANASTTTSAWVHSDMDNAVRRCIRDYLVLFSVWRQTENDDVHARARANFKTNRKQCCACN